jgi:hypothetical protein
LLFLPTEFFADYADALASDPSPLPRNRRIGERRYGLTAAPCTVADFEDAAMKG